MVPILLKHIWSMVILSPNRQNSEMMKPPSQSVWVVAIPSGDIPISNVAALWLHTYLLTCMHACMHTYVHTYQWFNASINHINVDPYQPLKTLCSMVYKSRPTIITTSSEADAQHPWVDKATLDPTSWLIGDPDNPNLPFQDMWYSWYSLTLLLKTYQQSL